MSTCLCKETVLLPEYSFWLLSPPNQCVVALHEVKEVYRKLDK